MRFVSTPNYKHTARRTISAIVLHYSHGLTEDVIAWMATPQSHTSVHYVISRHGEVTQMVQEHCIAWHAGRSAMDPHNQPPKEVNVNEFSLGVMLIGDADSGFTDRQLAALYALTERLVATYRIQPDRIVGHAQVAPGRQQDPDGYAHQFNWRKLHEVASAAFATLPPVG
jgi:N-acetyl-anhydromuramyl-L-alanine amidase AmpD